MTGELLYGSLIYDPEREIGHRNERLEIDEIVFPNGKTFVKITVLDPNDGDRVYLGAHFHDEIVDPVTGAITGGENFLLAQGDGVLVTQAVENGALTGHVTIREIMAPYAIYMPPGLARTFYLSPGSILYNIIERKFDPSRTHAVNLKL